MKFSTVQWIAWLGATVVAAMIGVSFVYTNFQTKAEAKETKDDLMSWMVRLDGKIDKLIDQNGER